MALHETIFSVLFTYLLEYSRLPNSWDGDPALSLVVAVGFPNVFGPAPLVSGNFNELPEGGSTGEVEVVEDPDRGACV